MHRISTHAIDLSDWKEDEYSVDVTIFVIWCLLLHVSPPGGNKVWMKYYMYTN